MNEQNNNIDIFNINNQITNNQIINNINNQIINNTVIYDSKSFFGFNYDPKSNVFRECNMCANYVHRDFYYANLDYCVHCWGWLNSYNLCLESGNYELDNISDDEIKKMLSKTFKLHINSKCTNNDCIYNRIIETKNNNKLNKNLAIVVGLEKDLSSYVPKIITNNERDININYKTSNIFI